MTRKTTSVSVRPRSVAALVLAAVFASPAGAVINPRFNHADLVRTSKQIVALRVSVPKDKFVTAEVLATLKGDAPSEKQLEFEIDASRDLVPAEVVDAFGTDKTATAVLALQGGNGDSSHDAPAGAMQIGIRWFAVFREQGKWRLGQDRQDLFAVWAGSAEKLIEGTRYVLTDPAASFPVRSDITWESDVHLGKLSGQANACLVADFGKPIGLCVWVLCWREGSTVPASGRAGYVQSRTSMLMGIATLSNFSLAGLFSTLERRPGSSRRQLGNALTRSQVRARPCVATTMLTGDSTWSWQAKMVLRYLLKDRVNPNVAKIVVAEVVRLRFFPNQLSPHGLSADFANGEI